MRRKRQQQDVPASGGGRVTPEDVQQVEFRLAFRGYNERDVDAFLDRMTEDLASYLEENRQLRAGGGPAAAGPAAAGPGGEPDEVLERARQEAAAIVRRAEEDAASVRAAAASGAGDARAAVAPFLNREREFLQGLGTLVQAHAEEIKQMVLALRARSEAAPIPEAAPGGSEIAGTAPAPGAPAVAPERSDTTAAPERSDTVVPAPASEIAERLGLATPGASPAEEPEEPEEEPSTVVIEPATEPAYSAEGASAGDRRERSLRELFWGED